MEKHQSNHIINCFVAFIAALIALSFWTSCGKSGVNPTSGNHNSQIMVVNASTDDVFVDLYINNIKQNISQYRYGSTASYANLAVLGYPLQIRYATGSAKIMRSDSDTTHANTKYTLYFAGRGADRTLKTILTVDTSTVPKVGYGKLRFVNVATTGTFDIVANGTAIFTGVGINSVANYTEMPAGTYDMRIYRTGDRATILYENTSVTIQDGRLYSLYSYGITGRTDSTAFNAQLITNK